MTTGMRQTRKGYIFQSFTPRWSGQLVKAAVYLGNAGSCAAAPAQLVLKTAAGATLATQSVQLVCDPAVVTCAGGQCAGWQAFTLAAPVAVAAGAELVLRLEGLPADHWVGVSPAAAGHGGKASLVVSPLFATKYAQYTFKTFMDTPPPTGTRLGQDTAAAGTAAAGGAGVIVPVILVALIVVLVAAFAYIRHKNNQTVDTLPFANIIEAPADVDCAPQPGGRKRPIRVNVRGAGAPMDSDGVVAVSTDAAWWEEATSDGQWATRSHPQLLAAGPQPVTATTATTVAAAAGPAGARRTLPAAPGNAHRQARAAEAAAGAVALALALHPLGPTAQGPAAGLLVDAVDGHFVPVHISEETVC